MYCTVRCESVVPPDNQKFSWGAWGLCDLCVDCFGLDQMEKTVQTITRRFEHWSVVIVVVIIGTVTKEEICRSVLRLEGLRAEDARTWGRGYVPRYAWLMF